MKNFIFLWWFLGIHVIGHAQTITVLDSESGDPIESATIMSESPRAFTTTNAEGQADISAFKGADLDTDSVIRLLHHIYKL